MATNFGGAVKIVARPNLWEKPEFPPADPDPDANPDVECLGDGLRGLSTGILYP